MENLEEFWQKQHIDKTDWLTGTSFDSLLTQYCLTEQSFNGLSCLEIGVGFGKITEKLSELTAELHCCDISSVALDRVKSWALSTWFTDQLDQIPPVDIAICHLVLVHCNDMECQRILRSVQLKPTARLYCQFSGFKNSNLGIQQASPQVQDMLAIDQKHFFRDSQHISNLIKKSGLFIERTWKQDPGNYHGWTNQMWHYYELRKY